jgi:drug/metabolite transporter (DMT)-like permease
VGSAAVHLVLVFVQVCFGTLPIAVKIALLELSSGAVAFLRVGVAALLFLVLQRTILRERILGVADYARLAVYAVFGVILNQLLYITALTMTTATVAQTLITTGPAMTLLVAIVLGKERASAGKWTGILLAGAGALYLVGMDFGNGSALGNLMVVLNVAAFSIYLVISRDILHRYDPLTVITWVFLFGAVGLAPWGMAAAASEVGTVGTRTLLALGWIVLVPTVASYYLNVWALKRVEASVVAVYVYLQPVVTAALAVPILGERLTPRLLVAVVLIFTGVGITAHAGWRARRGRPDPADQISVEV